ncbi:hypothetical protein LUZ61_008360 [Rhynchospora tenuis]|uniref:F-box domain-containing protein n=1 Tax=Rhynchospora tenuis TaxID=198213 RepID=A0AAD5ZV49_9POAL|nr:hypothetical protein LUZ61_008360 [Rhynchospora tenuis]
MAPSPSCKLTQVSSSCAGLDFLTDLPHLIKVQILALLPLKEAVRTSSLSKRWRHTWFAIPSLIIDENEILLPTLSDYLSLVYRLLSNHTHSLAKLKLVFHESDYEYLGIEGDLDKWIHTFSEKCGRELVLDFGYHGTVEIPARLFSLPNLEVLHLRGCQLNVPKCFDGFKLLHTLNLEDVSITAIDMEGLILSCPLLKYCFIHNIDICSDLAIRSQSLLELDIDADFKDLYFESPKLVTLIASVNLAPGLGNGFGHIFPSKHKNNISRLMCCLSQLQHLDIKWNFVKYMYVGAVPVQLPVSLNLTKMTIELEYGATRCLDVLLCLAQSAPKLCNLHVKFDKYEHPLPYRNYWDEARATDC